MAESLAAQAHGTKPVEIVLPITDALQEEALKKCRKCSLPVDETQGLPCLLCKGWTDWNCINSSPGGAALENFKVTIA